MKFTTLYVIKRIICTLLSFYLLLCLVACHKSGDPISETTVSDAPGEVTESTDCSDSISSTEALTATENCDDPSLAIFRQAMVETPQIFAAAFFDDVPQDADPFALMQESAPQLCEDLPFLLIIDQNHIVGTEGQLFCIVPADENATVAVNRRPWNAETENYEEPEVLYRSESGSPILVMCPNDNWIPDTEVIITDSSGTVAVWSPYIDPSYHITSLYNENGESLIFDFTSYDEFPAPAWNPEIDSAELIGTWELAWTEVEGDRNEAVPGACAIEITLDEAGLFRFTLSNRDFPEENVQDRELVVTPGELYPGCSNDLWVGDVTEEIGDTVHYMLTLQEDGTLLLQTYWEFDGMPMVSYGWYERIG